MNKFNDAIIYLLDNYIIQLCNVAAKCSKRCVMATESHCFTFRPTESCPMASASRSEVTSFN